MSTTPKKGRPTPKARQRVIFTRPQAPAETPQKPETHVEQAEVALRALRRRQAPIRRAFKGIHSMPAIARMNGALPPHKYGRRLRELALLADAAERAEAGS